ncbi:hypothetical protein BVY03_01885 [bacterium K02(2017)]|nr:hypothetical protein BVY03_01885 [bacterium K02(2017)]
MIKNYLLIFTIFIILILPLNSLAVKHASGLTPNGPYLLKSKKHLIKDYKPLNAKGQLQVVVEIPTGTTEKWEVTKINGHLAWEFKKGKPRKVKYLGYPGNYGMIPQTLLPQKDGGDGDPLDVIILGPPLLRGSIVTAKLIGVLELLDKGAQDDKLIAVMPGHAFYKFDDISALNSKYSGVSKILKTWFKNYKGQSKIKIKGIGSAAQANKILNKAIVGYKNSL